jgi:quinol-cytochrome oxidoreductase complex cytochrome b subunit
MFSFFIIYAPNDLGHSDNYIPANPLVTPPHIVPEWYFLPFYAILRSIPDKLGGVVAMISAILVLLALPVLNTSKIRNSKVRLIFRYAYWFLVADFILLGWIGQKPVESPYIEIGMGATFFYFFFLIVLIPVIGYIETELSKPRIILTEEQLLAEKAENIKKKRAFKKRMAYIQREAYLYLSVDFCGFDTPMDVNEHMRHQRF